MHFQSAHGVYTSRQTAESAGGAAKASHPTKFQILLLDVHPFFSLTLPLKRYLLRERREAL